jgi:hypothetical protein
VVFLRRFWRPDPDGGAVSTLASFWSSQGRVLSGMKEVFAERAWNSRILGKGTEMPLSHDRHWKCIQLSVLWVHFPVWFLKSPVSKPVGHF